MRHRFCRKRSCHESRLSESVPSEPFCELKTDNESHVQELWPIKSIRAKSESIFRFLRDTLHQSNVRLQETYYPETLPVACHTPYDVTTIP
jgi:hypothetical protein